MIREIAGAADYCITPPRAFMTFSRPVLNTKGMKQLWIAMSCTAVVLVSQSASMSAQDRGPSPSKPGIEGPKNAREWKHLRAQARTREDFLALTKWCESQAALSRSKQAASEAELREYYKEGRFFNSSKNGPRRDEVLTKQIESYKNRAKHWSALGARYMAKAQPSVEVMAGADRDAKPGQADAAPVKK